MRYAAHTNGGGHIAFVLQQNQRLKSRTFKKAIKATNGPCADNFKINPSDLNCTNPMVRVVRLFGVTWIAITLRGLCKGNETWS
jgi:hypothetical protein